MSSTTPTLEDVVSDYFSSWNASPGDRPRLVAQVFATDAYYCDGSAEAVGRSAIADMMAQVMTQFPGSMFELASPVDVHHQQARFNWRMRDSNGETIIDGVDVMRFDDAGQVVAALGFFGTDISTLADTVPHTFRWIREYSTPRERLFAIVSDLDIYAEVAPNLARIELTGGDRPGRDITRRCTNPEGESWSESYTSWVEGEHYATAVDVSTYPPSLAAMINALELSVSVHPVSSTSSRVEIEVETELTQIGVQVLRDGGAADALFQPILDGWETYAS